MAVFTVRLPDDLAARFDAIAIASGGRSAVVRKLIDTALRETGDDASIAKPVRARATDRVEIRLTREDSVQLDAAADARGLKRTEWLVMLLRRRLHVTSPPPRADRVVLAQSWRELNRIGINLNQAVHALHAATMMDSRLDLAREAARVASFRDEVADQLRALGRALKGTWPIGMRAMSENEKGDRSHAHCPPPVRQTSRAIGHHRLRLLLLGSIRAA